MLEGLEPVRLRPGMYIGSTGIGGLHHLVYEVVANSVDEALAGCNDSVEHDDSPRQLGDRRRPRPRHPGRRCRGHRHVRARGRADEAARRRQVRRRGLQGLRRPARRRRLGRERALRVAGRDRRARTARSTARSSRAACRRGRCEVGGESTETGTTISFLPDAEIFDETEFDAGTLVSRLREMAFLTKGLRITLHRRARRRRRPIEFHYEGGIKDFVAYINESKDIVHKHVVYFESATEQGEVEVAMQWNNSYQESVFSFANNINTHEGGSHLSGLPGRADVDAEQVRARQGAAEGEGRQPRRRGRARRARGGHLA